MEPFTLALVALQLLTAVLSGIHLDRRHRHDANALRRSLRVVAPALLASSLLPLVPLLAFHASAVLWGLWGAGYLTAALVYAAADSTRELPPDQSAPAHSTS
ncbi:hypothetical protein [Streptomyces sp. CdTB01]|uniref:hypothetical protein n=1 Tax=Streptomyces sp. CdTB01 TaxID=1725411 RepID=UPI000AEE658B|nr:hypothetical protein [Streptomyces sp. CdTB01]